MYSDGVVNACRDGEFFGEDRLKALCAESAPLTAQQVAESSSGRPPLAFLGSAPGDDIAVVTLIRTTS